MADERTFLEKSLSMAEKIRGRRPDGEQLAAEFTSYDVKHRATTLDNLEIDMAREESISSGSNAMRQQAENLARRRQFGDIHEALRKAGR